MNMQMHAMNIGREISGKSPRQLVGTPWFCGLLTVCCFVLLRIVSNIFASSSGLPPPNVGSADVVHHSFLELGPKGTNIAMLHIKDAKKEAGKSKKKVLEDIAETQKDLEEETKAFGRGDAHKVRELEHRVSKRLKNVRKARKSLGFDVSLDTQLAAVEGREHELKAFEGRGASLSSDASARDRVTQAIRSEEQVVKRGKDAMEDAKKARKREEQLLKAEEELAKKWKEELKKGNHVAASKFVEESQELEKKEQGALNDAKTAGALAHQMERQGLQQSRKDWEDVDGAAWPELGHKHVKVEDARLKLKHDEADFEERQKKDEEKHKKTLAKISELARKSHGDPLGSSRV